MKIKNYIWALPFFSFLAGYLLVQRMSTIEQLETPSIVGIPLQNAVAQLSEKNLNIRFIAQKEDPDLPQGTILSQTPVAGQQIKPHQALYVVISKKPQQIAAPLVINKKITGMNKELEAMGIRNKTYYLPSNRPTDSCITQFPTAGNILKEKKIVTYISSGNQKPTLVPNFNGKTVQEVLDFLLRYNVKPQIIHTSKQEHDHICDNNCIVSNQRPLAGSIITITPEKPLFIQIQVQ